MVDLRQCVGPVGRAETACVFQPDEASKVIGDGPVGIRHEARGWPSASLAQCTVIAGYIRTALTRCGKAHQRIAAIVRVKIGSTQRRVGSRHPIDHRKNNGRIAGIEPCKLSIHAGAHHLGLDAHRGIETISGFDNPKLVFGRNVSASQQIGQGVIAVRVRGGCLHDLVCVGLPSVNRRPGQRFAFESDRSGDAGNPRSWTGIGIGYTPATAA